MNMFDGEWHAAIPQRQEVYPGLLLGWDRETSLSSEDLPPDSRQPLHRLAITYDGDAPLVSCGITGSGKGRGALIPNIGRWPGPLTAIDIKGELYQVTARRRREMGQQVIAIDPFHFVTEKSDSLNPLDLFQLPRTDFESDAEMLASLLAVGNHLNEPYWNITANGLISALIAHIMSYEPKDRHLGQLRAWMFHNDMDLAIATLLDKNAVRSRMARDLFVAYLTAPAQPTRPCIRTTAASYLSALGSEQVLETLRTSSFRLLDVYEGRPLSIYIIIPPEKLDSHKSLLRRWVGTLLTAVMRRKMMPRQRTLFLLDECAQLGTLPMLRQAVTLLRGSGLQTWSFFQDLSQLRACYPDDWQTILNNAGALQVFGIANHNMAREWSELMGVPQQQIGQLAREDTAVMRIGEGSVVCRRPDYLKDAEFRGMFDPNPRFALQERPITAHQ